MKEELTEKEKFIPRDLGWLMFNNRVLQEALDKETPLLERLRFLAIFVNNLDEFQMVRVACLMNLKDSELNRRDPYGYYPKELLDEIQSESRSRLQSLYEIYNGEATAALTAEGIRIERVADLKKEQRKYIQEYFETILYPVITPLAVDPGHPFPVLPSRTMAFAVMIKRRGEHFLAVVPVPKNVPRLLRLPSKKTEYSFILAEDIIRANLDMLFKGYKIKDYSLFRVIRDSELDVDEDLTPDLLKAIESEVKKRNVAKVVYLEIEKTCSPELTGMLCEGLGYPKEDVVPISGHFDLTFLFELIRQVDKPSLFFPGLIPAKIPYDNIFDRIKTGDFVSHVPFQSFYPTVDLIQSAARDENVLAIKMTLYRTNSQSAIIRALKEAAGNNKQVTILVEIKARFDEENNIRWVRELETMGCHVIYGIPGLKVHSKMALIVRKEEGMIRRYVHLSTGNYNEKTARVYTDIGYFTANEDFARDISDVFNVITGYSRPPAWKRIICSPNDMREYLFTLIDREIKFQRKSKNGLIFVKMNSLEDPAIIKKIYEASAAGVKVQLLVRGICCLVPGIKGLSEHITVKSVVGRFLEHTRIFCFGNNGNPRYFLSSADWMRRNFDRRIELLFEILNEGIKTHLRLLLESYWKDNVKAWDLTGRVYKKTAQKGEKFNVQDFLIRNYGG